MTHNISHLGLGSAAIGRPQYINIRDEKAAHLSKDKFRKQGLKLLELAYQKGIRYFDTAPGYGIAEEMIMNWIKSKSPRDVEIASKWGYTYVADFNPKAKTHEIKDHSLNTLNRHWNYSKSLLPNMTTYQIHSATLDTGVLENQAILED